MIALEQLARQPSCWPYQPRPGGKHRLEPCVPVTFIGPRDRCKTLALVDSGADHTTLPIEWVPRLGVTLDGTRGRKVLEHGLGDTFETVERFPPVEPVRAEVAGITLELDCVFAPVWEPLLGRSDLFRTFRVVIDERAQHVILDPYPED